MIPQDDFAKSQRPHWLPFLDLEFITQDSADEISRVHELVKPVELKREPKSPSPTPTVPTSLNPKKEKVGFKSFIKGLTGRHRKKHDRNTLLLNYEMLEMPGWCICQLDEFLESVLALDMCQVVRGNPERLQAIEAIWAELQENQNRLPALWTRNSEDTEDPREARKEKDTKQLVFPVGMHWQFIASEIDRLPGLLDLLKELSAAVGGWTASLNGFAECAVDAFRAHASDEDCLAFAEFLVATFPHQQGGAVFAIEDSEKASALEISILRLFERCWASQAVFRLTPNFWLSPWWKEPNIKRAMINSLQKMATRPINWKLLDKPIGDEQAKAICYWTEMLPLDLIPEGVFSDFVPKLITLMQISGSPAFTNTIQGFAKLEWQPDESAESSGDGEGLQYGMGGLLADQQIKTMCWSVRRDVAKSSITEDDCDRFANVHQAIAKQEGDDNPCLHYLWRCYVRAAVFPGQENTKPHRRVINLIAEFMPNCMSDQEIRLICLCLPWLEVDDARTIADALFNKIRNPKSSLMRTVCTSPGLRQLVALQLATFSSVGDPSLPIQEVLGEEKSSKAGYLVHWNASKVGGLAPLIAYSSLTFWNGDAALKIVPVDIREQIIRWMTLLPACAHGGFSENKLDDWMQWLQDSAGIKKLLIAEGVSAYLSVMHVLGLSLVNGLEAKKLKKDQALPRLLVSTLTRLLAHQWPKQVLACEALLCFLLPFACGVIRENKSIAVLLSKLEDLGRAVREALNASLIGPDADAMPTHIESNVRHLSALIQEIPRCFDLPEEVGSAQSSLWKPKLGETGIDAAYRVLAQACLAVHLGASEAQLMLIDLRLSLAVMALQARPDVGMVLCSLLVARTRTSPWSKQ